MSNDILQILCSKAGTVTAGVSIFNSKPYLSVKVNGKDMRGVQAILKHVRVEEVTPLTSKSDGKQIGVRLRLALLSDANAVVTELDKMLSTIDGPNGNKYSSLLFKNTISVIMWENSTMIKRGLPMKFGDVNVGDVFYMETTIGRINTFTNKKGESLWSVPFQLKMAYLVEDEAALDKMEFVAGSKKVPIDLTTENIKDMEFQIENVEATVTRTKKDNSEESVTEVRPTLKLVQTREDGMTDLVDFVLWMPCQVINAKAFMWKGQAQGFTTMLNPCAREDGIEVVEKTKKIKSNLKALHARAATALKVAGYSVTKHSLQKFLKDHDKGAFVSLKVGDGCPVKLYDGEDSYVMGTKHDLKPDATAIVTFVPIWYIETTNEKSEKIKQFPLYAQEILTKKPTIPNLDDDSLEGDWGNVSAKEVTKADGNKKIMVDNMWFGAPKKGIEYSLVGKVYSVKENVPDGESKGAPTWTVTMNISNTAGERLAAASDALEKSTISLLKGKHELAQDEAEKQHNIKNDDDDDDEEEEEAFEREKFEMPLFASAVFQSAGQYCIRVRFPSETVVTDLLSGETFAAHNLISGNCIKIVASFTRLMSSKTKKKDDAPSRTMIQYSNYVSSGTLMPEEEYRKIAPLVFSDGTVVSFNGGFARGGGGGGGGGDVVHDDDDVGGGGDVHDDDDGDVKREDHDETAMELTNTETAEGHVDGAMESIDREDIGDDDAPISEARETKSRKDSKRSKRMGKDGKERKKKRKTES